MSGSTISTSETRIEALKLQSSAYGVVVAVVGGVNRVAGNLIDYVDFRAIPHTTTESAGGKGGGVKTQRTTYEYLASVIMGIAQGPVQLRRIWKGKELYIGGWDPNNVATTEQRWTIPASGPMNLTLTYGSSLIGAPIIGYSPLPEWWKALLASGTHYTIANGVLTILDGSLRGLTLTIQYQYGVGSPDLTPLQQLGLSLANGDLGQAAPSWMTAAHPERALACPGLAYVHGADYSLGSGAQVDNHTFEVVGQGAYRYGPGLPDCNPAEFTFDVLANGRYGARMPASAMEFTDWVTYCRAAGLLMSPALTEQQRAADYLQQIADQTNTAVVWSVRRLKMIPYGDTVLSGNGATYTPNTTPVLDLNDDWWGADQGSDPLKVERKAPSSAYNHFRIEFSDRSNYYNKTIAEAKDDADIAVNGLRTASTVSAPWICDAAVARLVVQIMLQRSLGVTTTYTCRLPWVCCLLELMDLVTITDPWLGFDKMPVRINAIREDEEGNLEVTMEDWPLGAASPTRYPVQVAGGYQHNYRAAPGSVDTPVIFEAPVELVPETGLQVLVAVRGQGGAWGGCGVWVSLDGNTYRRASTVYGAARYGQVASAAGAGASTLAVSGLGSQQLLSGSAADAAALETLFYVGGNNPEYLAYTSATLTGAGAYTLGGLVHGAYGTDVLAHEAGAPFVRYDDALGKSDPLTLDYIGRTIFFKFTSFNIYQQAEQTLDEVSAYPYTITGVMVELPPGDVSNFGITQNTFGVRASWTTVGAPGDIDAYEIRQGASWDAGTPLIGTTPTLVKGSSFSLPVVPAGVLRLWIKALDRLGVYSRNAAGASIDIAGPVAPVISWAVNGGDEVLTWTVPGSGYTIDAYTIRVGDDWDTGTELATVKGTTHSRRVDYGGARRYWVAAVDGAKNTGAPAFVDVIVQAPGAVGNVRADVVDNNALLYCSPPAVGTLPIDRYEVRKGASWAGGTVVGSNGNSTFFAIFEQVGGTYTYWLSAIDSAGNAGTPVSLAVKINQPPDYVLRADINSDFSGTKSLMFLDSGSLVGPFDTAETWATHFSSRSWTNIAAQIAAGYPLYAMPSATTGTYDETIDYGSTLPATTITVTPTSTVLAGTVNTACQLYVKLNAGDAWTALTGGFSALASNFRYVRVLLTFTATAGANLIRVDGVNIKLSTKLKTDSGKGSITNAAAGLAVSFNLSFLDADTPIVQPAGTSPLIPVVDFSDVPNPTGFTVYLYTTAGVKTTGDFSWTARGY